MKEEGEKNRSLEVGENVLSAIVHQTDLVPVWLRDGD